MNLEVTLALLAICIATMVFSGWRGAQPPNIMRGPRMVPWRFVMLSTGAISTLLLIHLAALAGMQFPTA